MGTFTNNEDPGEMRHNAAFHPKVYTVYKVKTIFRQRKLLPDTPRYVQ